MRKVFCRIDRKIIYRYIISSILQTIHEREGERQRWLPWTHCFCRLSTWFITKDTSREMTSTTLQLTELQLVLLRSLWSNTKGSVS